MIPHSWTMKSLQLVGVADDVLDVLKGSMTKWKLQLNAGDEVFGGCEHQTRNFPRR